MKLSVAFKEQFRPIIAYWVLLLFAYGVFALAIAISEGSLNSEDIYFLGMFFVVVTIGTTLGQIAALLRFREVIGILHGSLAFAAFMFGLFIGLPEEVSIFLGAYWFLGSIMFFAGLFSIQAGRAIYAAWPPIIFGISPVVILVNTTPGRLETWRAGSKWMVWNGATLLSFIGTTVLLMIFLVIRENLRVFRWRNGPKTTIASEETLRTEAKVRMSIRGWIGLLLISGVLSLGSAFLSPYLWQTVPAESGDDEVEYQEPAPPPEPVDCDNYSGCAPPPECRERPEPQGEKKEAAEPLSTEQLQEGLRQMTNLLSLLLWLFFLLLFFYLVFWYPLRRIIYVRHYRDPLWPVSATKGIENQWQLIRIALADLGVHGKKGDSAVSIVKEAIPKLVEMTGSQRRVPGLMRAAQIRDRVVFGLGVGPEDVEKMYENSNWVYDSVWNRLGNKNQILALYRRRLW